MAWFVKVSAILNEKAPASWDELMKTPRVDGAGGHQVVRLFDVKLDVLKRVRREQ
jgi:hypothetical protein